MTANITTVSDFLYCWFCMLRLLYNTFRMPVIRINLDLLLLLSFIASCSRGSDLHSVLDAAADKFMNNDFDVAQSELLKAEDLVADDTPISDMEYLERLKGLNYLELRVMDKAKSSLQKALEYSKEMCDTSRIIQNSFNLGLCDNTADEVIDLYEYVIELAENSMPALMPEALDKLAQGCIHNKSFDKAQRAIDRAYELAGAHSPIAQQIDFTQCELWLAAGRLDTALAGFKSIPADSCSMVGKLSRSAHIYSILCDIGDYKNALVYKDSVHQFSDSIKSIDGASRIQRIEDAYMQHLATEQERFKVLLYSFIGGFFVIAAIMFFVLKNLRLKRRQVALTDKIAELNVRLSELQPKDEQEKCQIDSLDANDVQRLIMEKFILSMEMLRIQPQYELLKKLNLMRDFDTENKHEIKNLYSEIIGRFSDACSSLRQTCPALTNDDSLLCAISYCGCSKEVVSVMMGSSDDAVRRRKSRVKQKLPDSLFAFFFK